MQRIGVIGPEDSVTRILEVARTLDFDLELVPCIYRDYRETVDIIKQNQMRVGGWLFSGPTPYTLASEAFGVHENYDYCSFSDASLYKCLLQVAYHHGRVFQRVSMDISRYESSEGALEDLGFPKRDIYIQHYDIQSVPEQLAKTHIDLWSTGRIDAAITGLGAVYEILKRDGRVPVYRNNSTAEGIRHAIARLLRKMDNSYLKTTQVGFEIVEILDYDALIERSGTPYALQLSELRIKTHLIALSEYLNGYLFDRGGGSFEISTSRGAVMQAMEKLHDIVSQLQDAQDIEVAVGIGFGASVSEAQQNARKALGNARKLQEYRVVVMEDNGLIIEGAGKPRQLSYEYYTNDPVLLERLHKAGVSAKTFKRITATIIGKGWDSFTAAQVADELGVTERNIRRIFSSLYDEGILESAGEETASARGRPSRLYRIT